ncbi:C-terminal processing protease CtpA/Prc [Dysgonomonadaceae bacterium PH5-43]|nr:C-terminal processing protease CtpA/Prc [Dysgonomonadaceae bacterium PH5-43]
MKNIILFLVVILSLVGLLCSVNIFAEETKSSFRNLDFEEINNGFPTYWSGANNKTYSLKLDSTTVYSGKYSICIEYLEGEQSFISISQRVPDYFEGKHITLSGYIKTENIEDGFAGLWLRLDPQIAFDNMQSRGITGTTDWTKYEITLPLNPQKTTQFVFGSLLTGKGKMWVDNLSISIDGKKPIALERPLQPILPAQVDKEFDNGSNITLADISNKSNKHLYNNLKDIALIWGFVKYYHPNVAAGKFNMDYELFRILPSVCKAKDNKERDNIILEWINKLGTFEIATDNKIEKDIKIEPDLSWIDKSKFSKELVTSLKEIKNAKRTNEHYYIEFKAYVSNPEFKNENPYTSMLYTDLGFRLLALYRYWNMIEYFYPYKYLIGEDWKNILVEFIPMVIAAQDEKEYNLCMLELTSRIKDTHAYTNISKTIAQDLYGTLFIPIELKNVDNNPIVSSFFLKEFEDKGELQRGDIIKKINGEKVCDIIKQRAVYESASNYPTLLRELYLRLLQTNDSILSLEIERNGKTIKKDIQTYAPSNKLIIKQLYKDTPAFTMLRDDIAYLNNGKLKSDSLPSIWEQIKDTKGLIIDIRNYPTDMPLYGLSRYLLPELVDFVKFSKGNIIYPGMFTFFDGVKIGQENNKDYYKGKVIIIVDESTQSSAEFHAMAYKVHPNAIVVGSTTAGADGNVSSIVLPGNIRTQITGIGVYYPNGGETQQIGIVPDIEVKPTVKGIKNGVDEVLEKCIEIINVE